ncbi:signal peptidase family protein [Babesia divergens]|uniref:Signal peptidase complex subunit 3 n=1 Tax=Babesia divergens TaxID=32595 RepID=A0AAD9LEB0_BABDI|nr:signal peptidase family protein [Babesia divergens]
MNTSSLRIYTLLNAAVFSAALALVLNYASGHYHRKGLDLKGVVNYAGTAELKPITGPVDRAALELYLSYDLRDAFDWNTNTIFLYVTANYETAKHHRNELIIHDKIIRRREDAFEPGASILGKYYMVDHGRSLRKTPVTLRMYYSVVPLGGFIETYQLAESRFVMPQDYVVPTPS